jgi:uncharacterized protein (TIGR03437 family)
MQINVQAPANTGGGAVPLKLAAGGTALNQGAITLWVAQ